MQSNAVSVYFNLARGKAQLSGYTFVRHLICPREGETSVPDSGGVLLSTPFVVS